MASRKTDLHVVGSTTPPPADPDATSRRKSVAEAAKSGTRLELLVAMRDRIAEAVAAKDCPPRDLASLTRRLQDISKDIEAIQLEVKQEAERGGTAKDEAFDPKAL